MTRQTMALLLLLVLACSGCAEFIVGLNGAINGGYCSYAVWQASYAGYWDVVINGVLYHVRCRFMPVIGHRYHVYRNGYNITIQGY